MFGRALLSPFSFLTPFVSLQEILRSTAQSRYLEIGSSRRSLLSYPPLHPVTQNLTFLVSLPITAVSPKYGLLPCLEWGGARAFTSFSRKVALESEKDIDRASGLSPSPGPGAPGREHDPAAALHAGSRPHAGPRPTPARLRRRLPSLSPGSSPFSSSLVPPFPSSLSFLSRCVGQSLPLLSPFSPALSISISTTCSLRSPRFIWVPPTVLPFPDFASLLRPRPFFLNSLPRNGRDSEAPRAAGRRAGVAPGLQGCGALGRRFLCLPAPCAERGRSCGAD